MPATSANSEIPGQTTHWLGCAVRGDDAALQKLALRLRPVLDAMARHRFPAQLRHVLGEEDLVQEVWAITLTNLSRLQPRGGRRTPVLLRYMRRAMTLHTRTLLRREIRRIAWPDSSGSDGGTWSALAGNARDVLTNAQAREASAMMRAVIDSLEEPKRSIVYLRGLEQVPNRLVAQRLSLSENTVSKIYCRALAELRTLCPDSVFGEIPAGNP